MIASHLYSCLAPFAQLVNKHGLSDASKCIQIEHDRITGFSPYGILEASLSIGIAETIYIDASVFVSVIKSLPDKEEVVFVVKAGVVEWECGMSTGKLAIMSPQKMQVIKEDMLPNAPPWTPTESFIDALELGAISCGSVGMASAGVYGVLLDNRQDFCIISTDNVTISACRVSDTVRDLPEQLTLSPEAVTMLLTVLNGDAKDVMFSASKSAVYCVNKAFRLLLRPIPPIKHDIRALASNFASADSVAALPRERLAAFIKRVSAMTENKGGAHVTLAAASGALSLSFSEGASSSDEYYLVEGLDVPPLPEIKLDAGRIARVLAHTSEVVLDHVERKVLVFRGAHPPFSYTVSGKSE